LLATFWCLFNAGTLSDRTSSAESDEALLAGKIAQLNLQCPISIDELIQIDVDIAPFEEIIDDQVILNMVTVEESEQQRVTP
jgi:hypothetical protein